MIVKVKAGPERHAVLKVFAERQIQIQMLMMKGEGKILQMVRIEMESIKKMTVTVIAERVSAPSF